MRNLKKHKDNESGKWKLKMSKQQPMLTYQSQKGAGEDVSYCVTRVTIEHDPTFQMG